MGITPAAVATACTVIALKDTAANRARTKALEFYFTKPLAASEIWTILRLPVVTGTEFEREKLITEDEFHKGREQVQELTDDFTAKMDELGKRKETEIMEV